MARPDAILGAASMMIRVSSEKKTGSSRLAGSAYGRICLDCRRDRALKPLVCPIPLLKKRPASGRSKIGFWD
jgi:hypothetical protein